MEGNEEPKVSEIINWGQGNDDIILQFIDGVNKMLEGYYALTDYGDEWWKEMNRSSMHDGLIREQWEKIDWDTFSWSLCCIQLVMNGEYIRPAKFVEVLKKEKELGLGYRPNSKEKRKKNEDSN